MVPLGNDSRNKRKISILWYPLVDVTECSDKSLELQRAECPRWTALRIYCLKNKLGKALKFLQSQATYLDCVNCSITPLKSNFLLMTKELEEFSQVSAFTACINYGNLC